MFRRLIHISRPNHVAARIEAGVRSVERVDGMVSDPAREDGSTVLRLTRRLPNGAHRTVLRVIVYKTDLVSNVDAALRAWLGAETVG